MRSSADILPCGCPKAFSGKAAFGGFGLRYSRYVPGCSIGAHHHAEARIIIPLNGEIETKYGRRQIAFGRGACLYRPAGEDHSDRYRAPVDGLTLLLPTDPGLRRLSEPVVLVDAALARAAQSLRNEADASDAAAPLVAEALATLISTLVLHNAPIVERGAARWIGQVREQVEAAADDVPTLGQLAKEVGRSPAHVAATFQRTYGASVGTYARRLRLWRARDRLVSHPQQGLAQVASECGYADQSHFTRHFRQMFGLGPGAYRARQCATFGLGAAAL